MNHSFFIIYSLSSFITLSIGPPRKVENYLDLLPDKRLVAVCTISVINKFFIIYLNVLSSLLQ